MTSCISQRFNAPDADVALVSSDGTIFKVHSRFLSATTGAFPPFPPNPDESIQLSEDKGTLELLLAFIYPKRHPHLYDIKFTALDKLAEAAEKYEVFAAMNLCNYKMIDFALKHPAEVLAYACKHDYPHLIEECCEYALRQPLSFILKLLPPHLRLAWVFYHEQFVDAWTMSYNTHEKGHDTYDGRACSNWRTFRGDLASLASGRKMVLVLRDIKKIFEDVQARKPPGCCQNNLTQWKAMLETSLMGTKPFRSFI